jgi:hypothetical protein
MVRQVGGTIQLFDKKKVIGASPGRVYALILQGWYYLVLYTVQIGTSKKGGNAPRAMDKKRKRAILILRKPHSRCAREARPWVYLVISKNY